MEAMEKYSGKVYKHKLFIPVILISCAIILYLTNTKKTDNKISVFSPYGTPGREISKLAEKELEEKGYDVSTNLFSFSFLTDYDIIFEKTGKEEKLKNKGKIKLKDVFGHYKGFYSLKYKNKDDIPEGSPIYFPDYYLKAYEEKAARILVEQKLFYLKDKHKGYRLSNLKSKKNLKIENKYNGKDIIFSEEKKLLDEGNVIFLTGSTVNSLKRENKNILVLEENPDSDNTGMFINKNIKDSKKIKDFETAVENAVEKLKKDSSFLDFHF